MVEGNRTFIDRRVVLHKKLKLCWENGISRGVGKVLESSHGIEVRYLDIYSASPKCLRRPPTGVAPPHIPQIHRGEPHPSKYGYRILRQPLFVKPSEDQSTS